MNVRTLYASIMTLFAFVIGFYAVMTLAFFFGETNKEWGFPLFITLVAGLVVWTAIALWRTQDARILTGISSAIVAGIGGWIIIPSQASFDFGFALLVLVFIVALSLLAGLFSNAVRRSLRAR